VSSSPVTGVQFNHTVQLMVRFRISGYPYLVVSSYVSRFHHLAGVNHCGGACRQCSGDQLVTAPQPNGPPSSPGPN
jgi:hypothetical protein